MKYKKVPGYVGIRKNVTSKRYEASKKIKGKTFSKSFDTIKEAVFWRNTFNPFQSQSDDRTQNKKISFQELWDKYESFYFPKLELSSQGLKRQKISTFMNDLKEIDSLLSFIEKQNLFLLQLDIWEPGNHSTVLNSR